MIFTSLVSCDYSACSDCEGHSEDLSYYRNLDASQDMVFISSQGEDINFQFVERTNNFGETQCQTVGSSDVNSISCNYVEDFHYTVDELAIQLAESIDIVQGSFNSKVSIEYITNLDSTFRAHAFWIDSTHIDLLINNGLSPFIDTLTNNLITYDDVYSGEITEVIDLDTRQSVPINLFTRVYFKPRTGMVGFMTLDSTVYLRI